MKVSEIMAQPVIVVNEHKKLVEIARLMLDNKIGCLPVVDEKGCITGIITESDFSAKEKGIPFSTFRAPQLFGQWIGQAVEQMYKAAQEMKAADIMSRSVVCITENEPVKEAVELLLRYDIKHLPVVRNNVPVGIVARHDLLRLMVRDFEV